MLRSRGNSPSHQGGYQKLISSPKLRKKINIDRELAGMMMRKRLRFLFRTRAGIITLLIAVSCLATVLFLCIHSSASNLDVSSEADLFSPNDLELPAPGGSFHLQSRPKPVRPNQNGRLITEEEEDDQQQICLVPKLSLATDSNRFAYHPMPALVCPGNELFYLQNGILWLNRTVLQDRQLDRCEYRGIEWMTDSFFTYTDVLTRKSQFEIKIKHDYMRIECYLKKDKKSAKNLARKLLYVEDSPNIKYEDVDNGKHSVSHGRSLRSADKPANDTAQDNQPINQPEDNLQPMDSMSDYINKQDIAENYYYSEDFPDFDQFLAQVIEKQEVLERKKELSLPSTSSGLNILMIAFDSMSHLCYQRKLPKLYAYMKDVLGGVVLHAYNIVGDATTAAIIPIMTGKTESELPEVRRNKPGSTYVDTYPLIWNRFEQNGYVTMFAEDQPEIGTFNLRFNGFEQIPTDHYMRPFWQAVLESTLNEASSKYCTGSVPKHMYMLNYTREFMESYSGIPKFSFTFFGDLTHNDNNPAEYADQDSVDMLERLRAAGHLDNTLVILMGDHGARYSTVRNTVQGKLEERLPMMSLAFPKSFRDEYPLNMKHLQRNAHRLTTPFDIYETLRDLHQVERLTEKPNPRSRGFSLLRDIPLNRTCASAGIPLHWCTCLHWRELDINSPMIQKVAALVVDHMNNLIRNQLDICHPLTLKKIEDAILIMPNEKVLKFQKSFDDDQRLANFSSEIHIDVKFYQILIETLPNNGKYEATIQHNILENTFQVTPDVSRINLYLKQGDCVTRKYPDLRKYCYCKNPPVKNGRNSTMLYQNGDSG